MKIHEYQATQIFEQANIPVVSGRVAATVDEAVRIAADIGYPVVLKSQVLVGGRGKAGGIKVVRDKEELERNFGQLRKLTIKGYPVEKILVVRAIEIKKEFYVGVTVDSVKNDVVLIASSSGGVEIEEVAKTDPGAIKKFYLHGCQEIDQTRWPEFIGAVFDDPAHQKTGTNIFQNLIKVFFNYDCSLAEINPLVIDGQGRLLAADAKINFDDNALFRHPDIQAMRDLTYEDADELEAKENNLSFVKLDGNVGCIVNGAGLAMGTMDIIKLSGGRPANFLDVGGSSNPQKVLNALKIILRNKNVKVVLINIFGGITRCDDIANGILQAKKQLDIPVPLVVRLTGTNEREAKAILAENNISTYSTMREAVDKVVELAQ
jgi:succinyl-CoA synthetase beta subunit